jgi:hypothetical protein
MSFRNFTKRLRYTDTFDANLPGELQVMVELKATSVGTELSIVQENIPRRHPAGSLLSWLAGVAAQSGAAGVARRAKRNPSCASPQMARPPASLHEGYNFHACGSPKTIGLFEIACPV